MASLVFAYQLVGWRALEALLNVGEEILAVVTHPDDPQEKTWFPSVAALARKHRIPVYTPLDVNSPDFVEELSSKKPDFLFSFYFRKILKPSLLSLPRRGAFNLHGSLLPKFRGRAPINWAIIRGEEETGCTLHLMEERADTGAIAGQKRVPILFEDTALTLTEKIAEAGYELLLSLTPKLYRANVSFVPQNEAEATTFPRRRPEDGEISWQESALSIYNLVRAVTHPFPGAFTEWNGKRLWIWWGVPDASQTATDPPGTFFCFVPGLGAAIATGEGIVYAQKLQLQGEPERDAESFFELHPEFLGAELGKKEKERKP